MKRHNGKKTVNKVDGGKKKAKRQYHKKLRINPLKDHEIIDLTNEEVFMVKSEPENEASIVEQVFSERNLTGFVNPAEKMSKAPVFSQSEHGTIRIEGEVTPEKIARAKEFENIFAQATGEIMDLAAFTPDPGVLEFVKGQRLSQAKIDEIKKAPAWTIFNIGGENLMKTQDNKLENVKTYCFRLERAVLQQVNLRREDVKRLETIIDLKTEELRKVSTTLETTRRSLQSNKNALKLSTEKLEEKGPFSKVVLTVKSFCGTIMAEILKLISK